MENQVLLYICSILTFQHSSVTNQDLEIGQAIEVSAVQPSTSSNSPHIEHHYEQLRNSPENPYVKITELRNKIKSLENELKAVKAKKNR